ncbi:hypothetical protein AMELA_G00036200 [Ameiurus melas]|uniref:SH3 domain-containing protein n=1 Tax=Ameiurus melas TaxID=219545 RepID=A0A7J6B8I5_AMEME|nr:hypothetical protein AMELA_G00036200 [Ameiurus melas]
MYRIFLSLFIFVWVVCVCVNPDGRLFWLWFLQPVLRHDVVVIGKPPRSPVMSRRSCGSPVKGQNYSPAHRHPARDPLEDGGEPFQALYNYMPHNEDELELKEGDIVDVMEKCDDGWFVGTSRRSKFFGSFPGNYVKRL